MSPLPLALVGSFPIISGLVFSIMGLWLCFFILNAFAGGGGGGEGPGGGGGGGGGVPGDNRCGAIGGIGRGRRPGPEPGTESSGVEG